MKLKAVSICNFRCYTEEISIDFADLTAIVGRNDVGKSTVLEALEIFFNNDAVKMEASDRNVSAKGEDPVSITCEFTDLPSEIVIDASSSTDLKSEYLLTAKGTLKIRKTYDCSKKNAPAEIAIIANHPSAVGVENLLDLKEKDLQSAVKAKELTVPLKGNPGMRKALWAAETHLALKETTISVAKAKEDSKRIWEEIEQHLPMFALFQSDRKSQDSDGEVQNPMKAAVMAALSEVQDEIDAIQGKIRERIQEIATQTHKALLTLDEELANQLTPELTPPSTAKWNGLFSVNMITDGVPLNKRGSGVRRLVLVSFFRAEADRRLQKSSKRSVIYAVEEPETSQHPNNQKILLQALRDLSAEPECQVILTTHSPGLASDLQSESIRFIHKDADKKLQVTSGPSVLEQIAATLGVTPDSRVKVLICVEGPTDVEALQELSAALHANDPTLPNLKTDRRFAFVPLGGGTLMQWVAKNYLGELGRRELHIYDDDVASYKVAAATVNGRNDGSHAYITSKLEIECYLHPEAINEAYGVMVEVLDRPASRAETVGTRFGEALTLARGFGNTMGEPKAKQYLAHKAFACMTAQRIAERDPQGEVRGWLNKLSEMAAL